MDIPEKKEPGPRYDQKLFPASERVNTLQAIVSPMDNEDAGLKINQDAWISRTKLLSGNALEYTLKGKDSGLYVFAIDGSVTINGQVLNKRDAAEITEMEKVSIEASADSDVLLLEVPMHI